MQAMGASMQTQCSFDGCKRPGFRQSDQPFFGKTIRFFPIIDPAANLFIAFSGKWKFTHCGNQSPINRAALHPVIRHIKMRRFPGGFDFFHQGRKQSIRHGHAHLEMAMRRDLTQVFFNI
jgi:hypothetical protein